mgnify:CR=1 FL=1
MSQNENGSGNPAFLIASLCVTLSFAAFVFLAPLAPSAPLPAAASAASGPTVQSIAVHSVSSLDHVVEGDTVYFTATLTMSDGSVRDGTAAVEWLALGYAGSIDAHGTFTAHLDTMVSEYGQAPGVVVTLYKKNGVITTLGASPIFNVYIRPESNNDLQG